MREVPRSKLGSSNVVKGNTTLHTLLFFFVYLSFLSPQSGARARATPHPAVMPPMAVPTAVMPPRTTRSTRVDSSSSRARRCGRARGVRGDGDGDDVDDDDDATSASASVTAHHWSEKLRRRRSGGEASSSATTHDAYRYNAAGMVKSDGVARRVADVLRDGDNVALVGEEALVTTLVAGELDVSDDEAQRRIDRVCALLPGLRKRGLGTTGARVVARWAADVDGLATSLLRLRTLFPTCDVAEMVVRTPRLLFDDDHDVLARDLDALRELFPEAGRDGKPDVDRMVQAVPQLLDVEFTRAALEALQNAMSLDTIADAARAVHARPFLALSVESAHLRSSYSPNFDQTHVARGRVRDLTERPREAYYDEESTSRANGRPRDPELPYW